ASPRRTARAASIKPPAPTPGPTARRGTIPTGARTPVSRTAAPLILLTVPSNSGLTTPRTAALGAASPAARAGTTSGTPPSRTSPSFASGLAERRLRPGRPPLLQEFADPLDSALSRRYAVL